MTACHDVEGSAVAVAGIRRVALVGSPNAGKTSVFNHLTGLRAKTGNYPGVTVGRSVGTTSVDGVAIAVEDLPGTYSLDPISPDEQVVTDLLAGRYPGIDPPDALVLVADATTLRRSILLIGQVLRLDLPCLLALTMGDELAARGGRIDVAALSTALGIPVAAVVAHHGSGIDELRAQLASFDRWQRPPVLPPIAEDDIDAWGQSVLDASQYLAPQPDGRTRRIDRVLLHPLWGTLTFFAVMFYFFQVLFTAAAPLRDGIGSALTWLGRQVADHVGNPVLRGLLSQGILGGVGTVLQFIPQIVLLFCLLAFLENVGYMSRAAFLMDRVMAKTGLEGRAFVAMLSSFACAIPGIMATRTLPSSRDRIATIVTAPLMTCSARLPVYTLLVGLLVAPRTRWWRSERPGHHDVLALPRRRTVRADGRAAGQVHDSARRPAAVHHGASALPTPVRAGDAGRDVECGQGVPPQSRNHHPGHLAGVVGAAQSARPGAADPGHVQHRCHRLRDESQLCRRPGSCCGAGVFAARLRLAHRHRTGRLAVGPRSVRLDARSGRRGVRSGSSRSKRWPA